MIIELLGFGTNYDAFESNFVTVDLRWIDLHLLNVDRFADSLKATQDELEAAIVNRESQSWLCKVS